jgi:hypothetical protein
MIYCAENIPLKKLRRYLCDAGPALCPKCPSSCAYGRRYVREANLHKPQGLKGGAGKERTNWADKRIESIMEDMAVGISKEQLWQKHGYANCRSMLHAIRRYKQRMSANDLADRVGLMKSTTDGV